MTEITYKGFRKHELEYQYDPRESVPEYPELETEAIPLSLMARDRRQSGSAL